VTERLLPDDLASRVAALLREFGRADYDPQAFALAARRHGIGLVDPERHRCWIDERVYEGALWRGHRVLEAVVQGGGWPGVVDEASGEFDG